MQILLTNDDGYQSAGLIALARAFEAAGHSVMIVAPDQERSASSHAITLFSPLIAADKSRSDPMRPVFAVNGTPTDCCKLALSELVGDLRIDLVASGINLGSNLGANIFYSGTIGGAFEGVLAGIPSVAISVEGHSAMHLDEIASMAVALIAQLMASASSKRSGDHRVLYNINFPAGAPADIKGVRVVPQGCAAFVDAYEMRIDPRQRPYYWLSGVQDYVYQHGRGPDADSSAEDRANFDDLSAVASGYVAVTPLRFDLNCPEEIERLAGVDLELRREVLG